MECRGNGKKTRIKNAGVNGSEDQKKKVNSAEPREGKWRNLGVLLIRGLGSKVEEKNLRGGKDVGGSDCVWGGGGVEEVVGTRVFFTSSVMSPWGKTRRKGCKSKCTNSFGGGHTCKRGKKLGGNRRPLNQFIWGI